MRSIGKLGGAGAMYKTMVVMGLLQVPAAWAGTKQLSASTVQGESVLILGAGIAGMTAAFKFGQGRLSLHYCGDAGSSGRANFTARRGTQVVEDAGPNGRTVQTCAFDEGFYINLGPVRLPFHHLRLMHYCKKFAIPLEEYVISNTANLYQTDKAFKGEAQSRGRIASDVNSQVAELLSKAIHQKALDAALTPDDRTMFLDLLRSFGDLSGGAHIVDVETPRAGCLKPMTVQALCAANPPLPLGDLLQSTFSQNRFYQSLECEWHPTLSQPVGGMDKIVDALVHRVGKSIRYHTEALEVTNSDDHVSVVCRDRKTGCIDTVRADYCLSNMPLPKLAKLKKNLSAEFT